MGTWLPMFYKHVAPLGLWLLGMPPIYKHVAPLGLNTNASNAECPYKHVAPLGLNTNEPTLGAGADPAASMVGRGASGRSGTYRCGPR